MNHLSPFSGAWPSVRTAESGPARTHLTNMAEQLRGEREENRRERSERVCDALPMASSTTSIAIIPYARAIMNIARSSPIVLTEVQEGHRGVEHLFSASQPACTRSEAVEKSESELKQGITI